MAVNKIIMEEVKIIEWDCWITNGKVAQVLNYFDSIEEIDNISIEEVITKRPEDTRYSISFRYFGEGTPELEWGSFDYQIKGEYVLSNLDLIVKEAF